MAGVRGQGWETPGGCHWGPGAGPRGPARTVGAGAAWGMVLGGRGWASGSVVRMEVGEMVLGPRQVSSVGGGWGCGLTPHPSKPQPPFDASSFHVLEIVLFLKFYLAY